MGVLGASRECLGGVWEVSGRCLGGVWKVSKKSLRVCDRSNLRVEKTFVSVASKPPAGARISKGPVGPLKF